jgi:hypothetical protein
MDKSKYTFNDEGEKLLVPTASNEQLERKTTSLRSENHTVDAPSKHVQLDISSTNINHQLEENTADRDSSQQPNSNHKISSNISHNSSVKGKGNL